ncbi:MAG: aa3-type cytochrome c oxidase subunit IV [Hyphomicrobium sp.]|nr:aa3-type cytochrome c oxidase subunit IV [Hyphomicrobium sp.]
MSVNTKNGHPEMDYDQHVGTYKGFIRFTQISIVLLVILLGGMYYFLV